LRFFGQKIGIIEEAKKAKFLPNGFIQILIFIGILFGSQLVVSIFTVSIAMIVSSNGDLDSIEKTANFYMLFGTFIISVIIILYVLLVEKRNLKSMGLGRKYAVKDYFIGYGVGIFLFSTSILILVMTGNMKYIGMNSLAAVLPMTIVFFFGFVLQGSEEEIMMS